MPDRSLKRPMTPKIVALTLHVQHLVANRLTLVALAPLAFGLDTVPF
jgi:hypothetical protein